MADERRSLGQRGEDAAVAYLERSGMSVVERNWRCQKGEVDVIALDGTTIVLVEVKTRRTAAKGSPEEAVTAAKQRRYRGIAQAYIQHAGTQDTAVRFDVISILVVGPDRALLRHHRSAFVCEP